MIRITSEDGGRVEVWTVARPQRANALDAASIDALEAAIGAAEARLARGELLRGVIITGEPRGEGREVFLSGADLREVEALAKNGTAEQARAFAERMVGLLSRLEDLGALVVAAIAGDVYGGGCELALACDLRIADEGIQLSFKQTRVGVASGWGGTTRLVPIVGVAAAKRLLLTGAPVSANEALRIGLVDEVVPQRSGAGGGALARAIEIVVAASEGAPGAIAAMKRGILETSRLDLRASFAREIDRFVETWRAPEHREALAAMREKRAPSWTAK
jgi:enoyl-CoA hydratase